MSSHFSKEAALAGPFLSLNPQMKMQLRELRNSHFLRRFFNEEISSWCWGGTHSIGFQMEWPQDAVSWHVIMFKLCRSGFSVFKKLSRTNRLLSLHCWSRQSRDLQQTHHVCDLSFSVRRTYARTSTNCENCGSQKKYQFVHPIPVPTYEWSQSDRVYTTVRTKVRQN